MDPAQLFETTVIDRDSGNAISFVSVPREALYSPKILDDLYDLAGSLDLRVINHVRPAFLPTALAVTLSQAMQSRPNLPPDDIEFQELFSFVTEELFQFAEYASLQAIIPMKQSPLDLHSLAGLATRGSGISIGAAAGFVAAGMTPFVLVTVPVGMVLGGAAAGVAIGLQEGLGERLRGLVGEQEEG